MQTATYLSNGVCVRNRLRHNKKGVTVRYKGRTIRVRFKGVVAGVSVYEEVA